MPILKINQIFWSTQGEGERAGLSAIFIRFAGCSLKCQFCDTKDAWQNSKELSIPLITNEVNNLLKNYPSSFIVLTGGEPLEQDIKSLSLLITELKRKNLFISIESNGNYNSKLEIDWWTISPKDQSEFKIIPSLYRKINEIKLVVNKSLNIAILKRMRRRIAPDIPIYLQPDSSVKNCYQITFDFYKEMQSQNIPNVKLGIQLHKIYNID